VCETAWKYGVGASLTLNGLHRDRARSGVAPGGLPGATD